MDASYEGQWNVNLIRLEALRQNVPSLVGEDIVRDYNAIVHALQVASHDENMVHFRIPDKELKPRVVSVQRAGRRSPGRTNYSRDNYCDRDVLASARRIVGLHCEDRPSEKERDQYEFVRPVQ